MNYVCLECSTSWEEDGPGKARKCPECGSKEIEEVEE